MHETKTIVYEICVHFIFPLDSIRVLKVPVAATIAEFTNSSFINIGTKSGYSLSHKVSINSMLKAIGTATATIKKNESFIPEKTTFLR